MIAWNQGLAASEDKAYDTNNLSKIQLDENKLWNLVEVFRKTEEREPYVKDERVCKVTEERASEMKDELSEPHKGFDERFKGAPFTIAENNTGAKSEEEALNNWLKSDAHASTLRTEYNYSCISCEGIYCVQIFTNYAGELVK